MRKSFSELVAGDPMAGRFTGLGFDTTGFLPVEASFRVRQWEVARFDLAPTVPYDVRRRFDEIRNLHVQGCLDYSHFTKADAAVSLAVEFVLKARLREPLRAGTGGRAQRGAGPRARSGSTLRAPGVLPAEPGER